MEIKVYRDDTKSEHLHTVHVAHASTITSEGNVPSSVSSLARYAKKLLVAQGKATEEEVEQFHYEAEGK